MVAKDIIKFVRQNIEPLPSSEPYGGGYRVSATLNDGTRLPCVLISSANSRTDLAIKRFEEERDLKDRYMGYRAIVKNFVSKGNSVNDCDIRDISPSPFAIPVARTKEIEGETSMGWTEFSAFMHDGVEFRFETTYLMEFFNMPSGYTASDIQKIIPAVRGEKSLLKELYRERPFFICYVDGL